jgi:hypothetical protein
MKNDKVNQVLEKILASFQSGEVPEALSIAVLPRSDVPCSQWSLSNRLIAFFSGTSDARGFRQWKEVGRYPKKGSKALYILTPRHKKVKDKGNDDDKMILTGFMPAPVFGYEDTDGEPIDIPDLKPQELPPLFDVAKKWSIDVEWQSFQGESYGYFSPSRKGIVLATHDEATFFHELAHAAHEKVIGKLQAKQDWKQEIVAELCASVLGHLYGKRINDGQHYRYIQTYAEKAGKDVHRACLSVISDVERCLNLIIDTQKISEEIPEIIIEKAEEEGGIGFPSTPGLPVSGLAHSTKSPPSLYSQLP